MYCGVIDNMGEKEHANNVVLSLMQGKLANGYCLFMDNYYNSFSLASKILTRKTYCTVILRPDRKFFLVDVKETIVKKGETVAKYSEGDMIGKWKDKRVVSYISSEYKNNMVTFVNKMHEEKQKPLKIIKYNDFLKGVDRGDQMMDYYPADSKTLCWYKKLFAHVIHICLTNAFHLCNKAAINRGEKTHTL